MTPSSSRPRITIERLRTVVLIGGALLVAAIVVFLYAGHRMRNFLKSDLPKKLGVNIESQADGVNYTQSRKGKILFKLHASRAVRMKDGDKSLLHDVTIDLYGEDGKRSDTISGSEFVYDPATGVAQAAGAVEILLMRPQEKPAIAELKPEVGKAAKPLVPRLPSRSGAGPAVNLAGIPIASQITDSQIHVKTSGLTFSQKTGVATTARRVDFALSQGNGSSIGATYDSASGQLMLDHDVELHIVRQQTQAQRAQGVAGGGPVTVHATHAEFERTGHQCQLIQALADYQGGTAQMADALIHFREDGSVLRVDGSGGVDLHSKSGAHVTAPEGNLEFDEGNHPHRGVLQGGAQLDVTQPNRHIHGSAPTAHLQFDAQGQLHQAHLEQGVQFNSRQQTTAKGLPAEVRRTWKSQTADISFSPAAPLAGNPGRQPTGTSRDSQVEPRTIHGYGGVVVTSETASNGATLPSRLAADTVVAELAPGSVLSSLNGVGHASFQERTAAGVDQSSSSDSLEVHFNGPSPTMPKSAAKSSSGGAGSEVASVVQIGHVVMDQSSSARPAGHASASVGQGGLQSAIHATANRSDYDGKAQLLHLSGSPRIEDGALDMTAITIDFHRATGDAFAHGDVKASWAGTEANSASGATSAELPGASLLATSSAASGNGAAHAIAAEAELHQATQQVVFRGKQARLWQAENSVLAPVITLNQQKQTLDAEADGVANPVMTVLVSNPPAKSSTGAANSATSSSARRASAKKADAPSVIRVRSGQLHYSEGERLAIFHGGPLGSVTAQTSGPDGTSTVVSQEAQIKLLAPAPHANTQAATPNPSGKSSPNSSIDRLTALGEVTVSWPDRKGTGDKLVYLAEDGTFTLTGTSTLPPRITDSVRGNSTGSALIFNSRSDSVTVEGDGGKTVTETQSSRKRGQTN